MLGSNKRKGKKGKEEDKEINLLKENSGDPEAGEDNGKTASSPVARAREHLESLTGSPCESVVGFERTEEGWKIRGVVVEVERIPPTTDILATFDVELNDDLEMIRCHRVARYWRSQSISADGMYSNGND